MLSSNTCSSPAGVGGCTVMSLSICDTSSLTSELKVAQVVSDDLLGALLRAQLDSAREQDVAFPSRGRNAASVRSVDVGTLDHAGPRLRLLTHTQVTHRGTFQRCIWGTNKKNTLKT
ncbi:hypothetical protein EYF80_035092 [Liparis tanakae]|uniref:Uncharacterized protein n=1 Tax=Liparis tanakae TaxID=230148 RepID=A0A4Z2GMZ3_9TELE|nr:hypothetical protein EYF80_035092 [Liparis tanakae]